MMTKTAKSATHLKMRNAAIKIYFDGGCRPNPGQMETAVVARGVTYHRPDCGYGTNNDAEWLALIHAAEIALGIGALNVVILGDSAFVVGQANLSVKIRGLQFQTYLDKFESLAADFTRIRVRKLSRNQNLAGIALAKTRL
jgi:ribonuclease HI